MTDQAANDLVLGYQDYMKSLARNIHKKLPARVDFEDIVCYGQVGLAEAASRFDFGSGASFETFAYYRIRGAIFDGIKKMSGAPPGGRQWVRQQSAVDEVSMDMAGAQPKADDPAALANHLGEGIKRLAIVITLANMAEEDQPELVDQQTPDQNAEQRELIGKMHGVIKSLPKEEAGVIEDFYFNDLTFTEIATNRGVNKSTVTRMHKRVLIKLQESLDGQVAA